MKSDQLTEGFSRRLREHGLAVQHGLPEERIRQFEEQHGVRLPLEVVDFLRRIDGMAPGDLDPISHIRIYALEDIRSLACQLPEYSRSVPGAERAFVVADFLLWSLGYAIWLPPMPVASCPVFLVGDGSPIRIADSFRDFLQMFIEGSPGLMPRKNGIEVV